MSTHVSTEQTAIEGCLKGIPFAIHMHGIESRMMYKVEDKTSIRILFRVESQLRMVERSLGAGWPDMEQEMQGES